MIKNKTKVVITIEDSGAGGLVDINTEFFPPANTGKGDNLTPAQATAAAMLDSLTKNGDFKDIEVIQSR